MSARISKPKTQINLSVVKPYLQFLIELDTLAQVALVIQLKQVDILRYLFCKRCLLVKGVQVSLQVSLLPLIFSQHAHHDALVPVGLLHFSSPTSSFLPFSRAVSVCRSPVCGGPFSSQHFLPCFPYLAFETSMFGLCCTLHRALLRLAGQLG